MNPSFTESTTPPPISQTSIGQPHTQFVNANIPDKKFPIIVFLPQYSSFRILFFCFYQKPVCIFPVSFIVLAANCSPPSGFFVCFSDQILHLLLYCGVRRPCQYVFFVIFTWFRAIIPIFPDIAFWSFFSGGNPQSCLSPRIVL